MSLSRRRLALVVVFLATLLLLIHATFFNEAVASGIVTWTSRYRGELPPSAFNFTSPPPNWLAHPVHHTTPMVFRIAFISHPSETERRDAIRQLMLQGVPASEVSFEHQFFVGTTEDVDLDSKMQNESKQYKDIKILDIFETRDHLSRKRHAALLWAAEAKEEFDYFMTADTDAFLRLTALTRRLRGVRPDLDPRKHQIAWGNMLSHWWHWRAGVDDASNADIDERFDGDWYHYPIGMMYLFSHPLVKVLAARSHELAHRIPYPCDDVVLGSWIYESGPVVESEIPFYDASGAASLEPTRDTKDKDITSLTTHVIHDIPGAHDPIGNWKSFLVDWDTICVHHVDVAKMRGLRQVPEWKDEWTM